MRGPSASIFCITVVRVFVTVSIAPEVPYADADPCWYPRTRPKQGIGCLYSTGLPAQHQIDKIQLPAYEILSQNSQRLDGLTTLRPLFSNLDGAISFEILQRHVLLLKFQLLHSSGIIKNV
jgi:hypothetical protein